MATTLETIVKQLEDSGIVAQGKLENFIPPKANPKNVEELVTELVKQNHLTRFQAQQVAQGKSKALILGSYTILDKIGAGGMGQVFKAQHRRMDRTVAIKMLPPAMTKDPAAVARFEREVRAAAKLEHPNIVTAHDADQANGAHFLVMQYVEGKDLSALVKKNGPFPADKAVNYILQAARGLEFAHSEGVIHRDIKPANLLLDKKGVVKILDMGLARIDGGSNAPAQAELTGTGAVMGTVDYMAPEQAMSTRDADARADIYSLGCSLHYLIAGKATYGGDSVIEKLMAHREKPIPNLRDVSSDVSEELEAVFRKMVAKNIVDRYQTMTEVIADLERCSSGQATTSFSIQPSSGTTPDSGALPSFPHIQVTPTIQRTRITKQAAPAKSSTAKQPPWKNTKVLIGAGAAGFLCLLLGVWVIIRDKDGKEVAKIRVPKGGTVSISPLPEAGGDGRKPAEGSSSKTKGPLTTSTLPPAATKATSPAVATTVPAMSAPVRWPLQPTKPEEIQYLLDCNILLHLRVDATKDLRLPEGSSLPSQGGTVVQVSLWPADRAKVNDEMLRRISQLTDLELIQVNFIPGRPGEVSITPAGIKHLASLVHLRTFDLNNTTKANIELPFLVNMPQLETLKLAGGGIDWCRYVSQIPSLRNINLFRSSLSDSDLLTNLTKLPRLETLTLNATGASPEALQKFAEKLPWCRIDAGALKIEPRSPLPSTAIPDGNKKATYLQPAFQQWVKEVQAMPAEQQIEAVSKKLMELNPGFDGMLAGFDARGTPHEKPKVESNHVTEIGFFNDHISDLSPLRAFPKLQQLACYGSAAHKRGMLSDLSPLSGMSLTKLTCSDSQVADLSPLQGMPLTWFACGATNVRDLSPLKGMELKSLYCSVTAVRDLSPLEGMPINDLGIHATPVSDLSPLANLPKLDSVNVRGTKVSPAQVAALQKALPNCKIEWDDPAKATKSKLGYLDPAFQHWMKDVAALPAEQQIEAVRKKLMELNPGFDGKVTGLEAKGTPKIEGGVVTEFGFFTDNVTDISPVRVLAGLKGLFCSGGSSGGKLSDLTPLQGMKLTYFTCNRTRVVDLSPLNKHPLGYLNCSNTEISDLSPLQGASLSTLRCDSTKISDLSPLRGMPLKDLLCSNTQVADLSPLKGMNLVYYVQCDSTKVSDLSPLQDCKILGFLFVGRTKVTPVQVAALQKALPKCKIEWDDPAKPKTPEPAASSTK